MVRGSPPPEAGAAGTGGSNARRQASARNSWRRADATHTNAPGNSVVVPYAAAEAFSMSAEAAAGGSASPCWFARGPPATADKKRYVDLSGVAPNERPAAAAAAALAISALSPDGASVGIGGLAPAQLRKAPALPINVATPSASAALERLGALQLHDDGPGGSSGTGVGGWALPISSRPRAPRGCVQITVVGMSRLPDWLQRPGFGEWLLAAAGLRAAVEAEFHPVAAVREGAAPVRLSDKLVLWARLPAADDGCAAVPSTVAIAGCGSLALYVNHLPPPAPDRRGAQGRQAPPPPQQQRRQSASPPPARAQPTEQRQGQSAKRSKWQRRRANRRARREEQQRSAAEAATDGAAPAAAPASVSGGGAAAAAPAGPPAEQALPMEEERSSAAATRRRARDGDDANDNIGVVPAAKRAQTPPAATSSSKTSLRKGFLLPISG